MSHWTKTLLLASLFCASAQAEISVTWDSTTRQFATSGVYARVKKLSSGNLALVYSRSAAVRIRTSTDGGATWGVEREVARDSGYDDTNAEMLELSNGWLVYGWNGRPTAVASPGVTPPYFIGTVISRDGGLTWGDKTRAYTAGNTSATGCWEPVFLQLPSGELQLYFANEAPYTTNNDQEIGMLRSQDSGRTWGNYGALSHRAGYRDGMPSPLYLKGGKGVAMSIEDDGVSGYFKPVIIHAPPGDNWSSGTVGGQDARRAHALAAGNRLPSNVYAGAPYLVQLPAGVTLLSVQSTEGRTISGEVHLRSVMKVYAGNDSAADFSNPTTPFPDIPATGNGLWNALTVLNDSMVMAVSSVNHGSGNPGSNGIWTVIGRISGIAPVATSPFTSKSARAPARIAPRASVPSFSGFDPIGRSVP
jgi:hypothetical protein